MSTLAEFTAGECFNFISHALEKMKEAKMNVLLEASLSLTVLEG